MKPNSLDAVQKILGEPVFIGFSDEVLRARRNLILLSFVFIAYKFSGADIKSINPLGIEFDHAQSDKIEFLFIACVVYSLIHFIWLSYDSFVEWRLRITGTNQAFYNNSEMDVQDYHEDPRQSTLMNWWLSRAKRLKIHQNSIQELRDAAELLRTYADEKKLDQFTFASQFAQIQHSLSDAKSFLANLEKTIENERLDSSLFRFEKYYLLFLSSQNLRWILIEFGVPIALAISAICYYTEFFEYIRLLVDLAFNRRV